jgi:DNA replication factor GINS
VDLKVAISRQLPPADESPTPDGDTAAASDPAQDRSAEADTERTTLRIARDVSEIFGVDEQYDLASEDVVTLPTPNAEQLLDRDTAERPD